MLYQENILAAPNGRWTILVIKYDLPMRHHMQRHRNNKEMAGS